MTLSLHSCVGGGILVIPDEVKKWYGFFVVSWIVTGPLARMFAL